MQDADDLGFFGDGLQRADARDGAAHGGFGGFVRDHDQGNAIRFGTAMLDDGFDADVFIRKQGRNLCQDAGFVVNGQAAVTPGLNVVGWNEVGFGQWCKGRACGSQVGFAPFGDGDEIGDNRAGRGQFAGPLAVENLGIDCAADDFDRVKFIANIREERIVRHEGGMYAGFDAVVDGAGDAEQFDGVAEFAGKVDVQGGDVRDALFEHIAG